MQVCSKNLLIFVDWPIVFFFSSIENLRFFSWPRLLTADQDYSYNEACSLSTFVLAFCRFSTATGTTVSSMRYGTHRQRRRRRFMPISRISEDVSERD